MGQSRAMSAIESIANVVIGYGLVVGTQVVVFPWFSVSIPFKSNLAIGMIFTIISLIRSYVLRRLFNATRRPGPQ